MLSFDVSTRPDNRFFVHGSSATLYETLRACRHMCASIRGSLGAATWAASSAAAFDAEADALRQGNAIHLTGHRIGQDRNVVRSFGRIS